MLYICKMITNTTKESIIELYKKGWSQRQIGLTLNICRKTIRDNLKKNSIEKRKDYDRKVEINPFEDLSNPEVQYWLGWIITDGNIHDNSICLALQIKDVKVLENYCKFLKIDLSNIKIKKARNVNHQNQGRVRFRSTVTANFLQKIGITKRKSLTIDPTIEFTSFLMRGLIEGDGSIFFREYSKGISMGIIFTTASVLLKNKYCNFLDSLNTKYNHILVKNCYVITINGKNSIKLIESIYPEDCTLYCERKYETAIKIKNEIYNTKKKNIPI